MSDDRGQQGDMRRRRRKLKIVLALAGILVGLWAYLGVRSAREFRSEIQTRLADADRVVLDFNPLPDGAALPEKWAGLPKVNVDGKEKVQQFLRLLDFKYFWPPQWHCRCIGELAFRFECENQDIAALTLHHGESLRWCSLNPNSRNHELTVASLAALHQWIEQNAGEAYRAAQQRAEAFHQELREKEREEASSQPSESAPATSPATGIGE